jgi:hypothetical protein
MNRRLLLGKEIEGSRKPAVYIPFNNNRGSIIIHESSIRAIITLYVVTSRYSRQIRKYIGMLRRGKYGAIAKVHD